EVVVEHGDDSLGETGGSGSEPTRAVAGGARRGDAAGGRAAHRLRSAPAPRTAARGRVGRQILPTRSSDGFRVFSPSFHLAGQTSFGWAATYCAALSLRRVSVTSRAIALSWISTVLITPSGLITKVPRRARPSSSMCTPKARVSWWVGSPTSGNWALPTAAEVSCQTLWEKWVSVVTM